MKKLLLTLLLISSSALAGPNALLKKNTYRVKHATGFMVKWKDRTFLVTNWHVCRHFSDTPTLNDEEKIVRKAHVEASFPQKDLCLLSGVVNFGLEIGKDLKNGYPVYTAGYPQGTTKLVLSSGITVQTRSAAIDFGGDLECPEGFIFETKTGRDGKPHEYCNRAFKIKETTMRGSPGCSGSAVVNSKGKLVGIVNEYYMDEQGTKRLGYLPVSTLVEILKSLESK